MQDAENQRGDGDDETDQRADGADVKQCASGADGRAHQNESAERADQRGKGNEERIAGVNVVMAAGEKMAEFMSQQNSEQREGEGQAGEQRGGMLVEERVGVEEFGERGGLILLEGDGELRACGQSGAEGEQEESYGQEEAL